jgi:hypothetical protein
VRRHGFDASVGLDNLAVLYKDCDYASGSLTWTIGLANGRLNVAKCPDSDQLCASTNRSRLRARNHPVTNIATETGMMPDTKTSFTGASREGS